MLPILITFLSAFLVFLVQPMVAKMLLPAFGGGASVWTGCLLFFQTVLLAGYGYSHLLSKIKRLQSQFVIHSALAVVAAFSAWISFQAPLNVLDTQTPLWSLLATLIFTIGLPYFVVSTTAPLIQFWLAKSAEQVDPYRLYALSNAGSLLALFSYPVLIEANISLPVQSVFWSIGLSVFTLLIVSYVWKLRTSLPDPQNLTVLQQQGPEPKNPPSLQTKLLWLLLSATGVIALIATTSAMTQNVPPVPFLWVLPLAIYLVSFIITFEKPSWYVRWYWLVLMLVSSVLAVLLFFLGSQFDLVTQVLLFSVVLFAVCMVCHGELASLKPDVNDLTLFYLFIALGGFLGSAFVNFVAVELFSNYYEFIMAVILSCVLFVWRLSISSSKNKTDWFAMGGTSLTAVVCLVLFISLDNLYSATNVVKERNFYGLLAVKDVETEFGKERRLVDGTTSHGTQSLELGKAQIAKSYYREGTGVAMALRQEINNKRVGLVGLGAGTLAAYGNNGDSYVFYELNPAVSQMAQDYFTYLADSKASIDIVLGDGRSSLQSELDQGKQQNFDVLVIDAFSGDSIPMHLLTVEALELYFQHLAHDGVLAFHISNSHLDLTPVLKAHNDLFDTKFMFVRTEPEESEIHQTLWVLMAKDNEVVNNNQWLAVWPNNKQPVSWTDNFSDLLSVLK